MAGFTAAGPHILPAFDAPPQRNILILGDSLSAGYGMALDETWVARLAARLDDRGLPFAVANASISGETSGGGLTRLPRLLETFAPALVIIELGANDGLRGISLEELRGNLEASIELVQEAGAGAVLVGMELPPNYGPAYQAAFRGVFADVAQRTGLRPPQRRARPSRRRRGGDRSSTGRLRSRREDRPTRGRRARRDSRRRTRSRGDYAMSRDVPGSAEVRT